MSMIQAQSIAVLLLLGAGHLAFSQTSKYGPVTGVLVIADSDADCKFDGSDPRNDLTNNFVVFATQKELQQEYGATVTKGRFSFQALQVTPSPDQPWHIVPLFNRALYRLKGGMATAIPVSSGAETSALPIPICLVRLNTRLGAQAQSGTSIQSVRSGPYINCFLPCGRNGDEPRQSSVPEISGSVHAAAKGREPGEALGNIAVTVFGFSLDGHKLNELASTVTNAQGAFSIAVEDSPYYMVSVESTSQFQAAQVLVMRGDTGNVQIEVSPVQALPHALESRSFFEPTRRQVFFPEELTTLPLLRTESFDRFVLLAPGVAPPPQARGPRIGPGLSPALGTPGQFSANGLRARENNFSLDGADNNDEEVGVRREGFLFPAAEPVETVRELQLVSALYDVQFGHSLGAQVNALSKSGTPAFHGAVFGYGTDQRFNALNYFERRPSHASFPLVTSDGAPVLLNGNPVASPDAITSSPALTRTNLGATFGGPFVGGAGSFFSAAFETQQSHSDEPYDFAVPTAGERGFNPTPTATFPSNLSRLYASNLYPSSIAGDGVFSLFPFPNNPLGAYGPNTFTTMLAGGGTGYRGTATVDHAFNFWRSTHSLSGRYYTTNESTLIPETGDSLYSSMRADVTTYNGALFFTTSHANAWTNTIRASYGTAHFNFTPGVNPGLLPSTLFPDVPFLLNANLLLNVTPPSSRSPNFVTAAQSKEWLSLLNTLNPGANVTAASPQLIATADRIVGPVGEVTIAGFSPLGVDVTRFPERRSDGTIQSGDLFLTTYRQHSVKLGFDLWHYSLDSTQDRNVRPSLYFGGEKIQPLPASPNASVILDPTSVAATGSPSDLFLTLSSSVAAYASPLNLHRTQFDMFLGDDWVIAPNFHVSLGLRIQNNRLPESSDGRFEQDFNSQALQQYLSQSSTACTGNVQCLNAFAHFSAAFPANLQSIYNQHKFAWDPRSGFAWDVFNNMRTVLRGGFGRYTSQFPSVILSESRSAFPRYLPLNLAGPPEGGFYLYNISNGYTCTTLNASQTCSHSVLLPFSLNVLNNAYAQNPLYFLASQLGGVAVLTPTQPATNLDNPYSLQYGLTLDQAIGINYGISIAFVGTQGRHLLRAITPMATNQTALNIDSEIAIGESPFNTNGFAPFPVFDGTNPYRINEIPGINPTLFETGGVSSYNSLQMQFHGRIKAIGLSFGSSFTYAHAIDDASDFFDTAGTYALAQNSYHFMERGDSSFDIRLRSTTYFLWWLPRPLNKCRLSGIFVAESGEPFTVNTSIDVNQDGNFTDRLNTTRGLEFGPFPEDAAARLRLAPGVLPSDLLSQTGLNSSFGECVGTNYCDGAVGRNTFRSWGLENLDLSVARTFIVNGERGITARVDAFNVLNHPQFGIPIRILEAPAFGRATTTQAPNRTLQLSVSLTF